MTLRSGSAPGRLRGRHWVPTRASDRCAGLPTIDETPLAIPVQVPRRPALGGCLQRGSASRARVAPARAPAASLRFVQRVGHLLHRGAD